MPNEKIQPKNNNKKMSLFFKILMFHFNQDQQATESIVFLYKTVSNSSP